MGVSLKTSALEFKTNRQTKSLIIVRPIMFLQLHPISIKISRSLQSLSYLTPTQYHLPLASFLLVLSDTCTGICCSGLDRSPGAPHKHRCQATAQKIRAVGAHVMCYRARNTAQEDTEAVPDLPRGPQGEAGQLPLHPSCSHSDLCRDLP